MGVEEIIPENIGLLVSTKNGGAHYRITAVGEEKFLVMTENGEQVFNRKCSENRFMSGREYGWFLFGELK